MVAGENLVAAMRYSLAVDGQIIHTERTLNFPGHRDSFTGRVL